MSIPIALYSHDTMGLGHTRRNLAVASAIAAANAAVDILIITGNPEATQLPCPARTDIVTLPTITKDPDGGYRPRRHRCRLDELITVRSQLIKHTLQAFGPQLLVVDKVAAGVEGELLPALTALQARAETHLVLGLREILDAPSVVRREWQLADTAAVIKKRYHEIWLYGDPTVFDAVAEYGWDRQLASMINYTGYLGHAATETRRPSSRAASPPEHPYVLCQVGGGQDGRQLATAFARSRMPYGHRGVIITGPFLSDQDRQFLIDNAGPGIDVIGFVGNVEDFIANASAVVSMAGYNATVELLGSTTPALLVPRTTPRTEQLIRAERLARRGCVDLIAPERLRPERLTRWLADAITRTTPQTARAGIDLTGLARVGTLANRALMGVEHAA